MTFTANGIHKQRLELSKLLQDRCIDLAFLSETHLKPHETFFIYDYHVYRTDRVPNLKGQTLYPPYPCWPTSASIDRSHRDQCTDWKQRGLNCSCLQTSE